jgi:two-component system, chemotaxis family, protein-glutamate methylesterase/glutaminase
MEQYGVLVVDDSAFMRRAISQIIESDPQFIVVGIARDGEDAVEKVKRLKPHLVTMDVEMPKMNGLEALQQIMESSPVPVVMLSSRTGEGAKETLIALERGAVDFFLKDNLIKKQLDKKLTNEFLERLKGIVKAKLPSSAQVVQIPLSNREMKPSNEKTELLFIGCSTGGPSALQAILPHFPKDFPIPIVVAQHMPPGFTKHLAERFDSLCAPKVREATNGQVLLPGTIYIAPSGFQTRFEEKRNGTVSFIVDNDERDQALYKPCIDITLNSAAPIFTTRLLSVILTGMGVDGMKGCGLVKMHGGHVFVESEESCIVYGMPKSVMEAGFADRQFALSQMHQEIMSFISME